MSAQEQSGQPPKSADAAAESNSSRQLDALYRVNNFMARVTNLRDLLVAIMDESKQVAEADASALMLYDEPANELYFEVALGSAGDAVKEIRLKADQGIAGSCAQSRETIVVADCANDERHAKFVDQKSSFSTRNLIATPLLRGDRLIGVLEVLNKKGGRDFTDEDTRVIRFFADQAAIAIENALLFQTSLRNERLAAVGQAILSVSHYIKNILVGMKGSGGLIEMAIKGQDMKLVETAWPIVQRSLLKISNLAQDMLSYSKERQPDYIETDLAEMLEDIARTVKDAAAGAGVEIVVEADPAVGLVEIDETALHDAVLNTVVNAIDACKEGAMGDGRVTLRSGVKKDPAGWFFIEIEDNGPGIPEEIRNKIFDAFFSTKGSKGTGLGLAVTMKTVKEHGGKLDLESEVGMGTRFTLSMPIKHG
jgi:signal transduction histidine kinase